MTLRISEAQSTETFINQVNRTRVALEQSRDQLGSGIRVEKPSDEPGRAGTIASLQSTLQRLERHKERITFATDLLSAQEGAIDSANSIMIRLEELATQGANETLSESERSLIAEEVFELRDALGAIANTKHQDIYIFGGLDSDTPPFSYNNTFFDQPATGTADERGHWEFNSTGVGQTSTREVVISDSERVRINTAGDGIFRDSINAATRLGRALMGYETVVADSDTDGEVDDPVATGNNPQLIFPAGYATQTAEIRSALDELGASRSSDIVPELSSIGARMNRLRQSTEIIDSLSESSESTRASFQDADAIAAASEFANLQTSLEALLTSGARINQLSLLNFI